MSDKPPITVLCLDMAGTTVRDDGTVMTAFTAALAERDLPVAAYRAAMTYVAATMGQSKIDVFRHVMGGDEAAARQVNASFERHYAAAVAAGVIGPLPGARADHGQPRRRHPGMPVHRLLSGHPGRHHRRARLGSPGRPGLVPADADRGRPWPDMPLAALLRLGGGSVHELAVAGDTPSDVQSGLRAGAGLVAGVLTGTGTASELAAVPDATGLPGRPLILDSVAGLLPCLGLEQAPN